MVGREGLGAYVGGLGPLLGPMLAVLGRSWGLCWRSWAALGAHVGGLGSGSGPKLAVLGPMLAVLGEKWPKPERGGDLASGSEPKSGPNPSGSVIRKGSGLLKRPEAPRSISPIFSIDVVYSI